MHEREPPPQSSRDHSFVAILTRVPQSLTRHDNSEMDVSRNYEVLTWPHTVPLISNDTMLFLRMLTQALRTLNRQNHPTSPQNITSLVDLSRHPKLSQASYQITLACLTQRRAQAYLVYIRSLLNNVVFDFNPASMAFKCHYF